jgi:hypothetical protein
MFFSVSLRYTNKRACPESCRAAKYDEECQILRVMGFHGFLAMLMTVGGWENRTDFFKKKKHVQRKTNIATWNIVILNSSCFSQSQYISSTTQDMMDMVRWSLNLGSMVVQLPPKSSGNCFLRLNRGWRWLISEPDHILVRSHLNIRSRYGQK